LMPKFPIFLVELPIRQKKIDSYFTNKIKAC
jgi:hypothetical protein